MTDAEFNEWFSYHASCFTGLHSWLGRFPATAAEARDTHQPTQERILQRWFRVLESVELRDAKRASDALHAGDEAEPKAFDKHPGAVRSIAEKARRGRGEHGRQLGPRMVGGEEVVNCVLCHDWGRVSCWHPESMKELARGESSAPWYTCSLACTCEAGKLFRRTHRVFNPKLDLPMRREDGDGQWRTHWRDEPEEHAAVQAFTASIREEKAAADPQGRIAF